MFKSFPLLFILLISIFTCKDIEQVKLEGTPISSDPQSKTLLNAFSEDLSEEFKSNSELNGWVGLELKSPHKITRIGFAQKSLNKTSYILGIFEGSNDPDFFDSYPLYMITNEVVPEKMNYVDLDMTYSFKYVRYIGPNGQKSVISGLEFYGIDAPIETEEGEEKLYQPTEIPLIIINTELGQIPRNKDTDINCIVKIIDKGKRDTKEKGVVKLRGNNTSNHPKKPYKIKFDSKTKPLDFPSKAKKWNLLANFYDKSLLRTLTAMKLSEMFKMKYTPQCKPIDLIINGEYKGNYYLCDKIEVLKGRLDLDEMDETSVEEPEITGGYLIEANSYTYQDDFSGQTLKGIPYTYKYPKGDDITPEQISYIDNFLNIVEEEVYQGITKKIDVNSFIKFMTITEIAATTGAVWSTYLHKERDEDKLYFGPIWDYDNSFGDDYRTHPIENFTNFNFKYYHSAGTMKDFVINILNDEEILKKYKDNWKKISESNIREELMDFIDEKYNLIKESARLNYLRWDTLKRIVGFNIFSKCTYDAEVEYLKEWILLRFDLLDGIFENANIETVNQEYEEIHTKTHGSHSNRGGFRNNTQGWGGFGNNTQGWGGFGNNTQGWGGFGNNTQGWGGFGNNTQGWGGWGGWGGNSNSNRSHYTNPYSSLGEIDKTCLSPEELKAMEEENKDDN